MHEPWWTATARHADIVLPATTSLERNDIGAAHRDRYVFAMQQAIEPVGEARSDFAIFAELSRRVGCEAAYTQGRDEMEWLRHLYDRWRDKVRTNQAALPDFDGFWKDGFFEMPLRADEYVMFGDFRADPQQHKLATPSGRIELYSERIAGFGYDDCPPHPTWLEPAEWLGASRHAKLSAASGVEPAALSAAQPDGSGTGQRAGQGRRPRGGRDQSSRRGARAASPMAMWCACTMHAAPVSPARS